VVCAENIVADAGGSVLIPGLSSDDAPITVGLAVNYCDISE
jgi:hypothetical protein